MKIKKKSFLSINTDGVFIKKETNVKNNDKNKNFAIIL